MESRATSTSLGERRVRTGVAFPWTPASRRGIRRLLGGRAWGARPSSSCGPARVLETLCELAAVDVALDLDHDYAGVAVEGDDVRATADDRRLSCDRKEGLARESGKVVPEEILDLALVEMNASASLA